MRADDATLEIVLEDVGGTSWTASLLTTLDSQYGSQTLRFVGRANGENLFESDHFMAGRPVSPIAPSEDWAPGMTDSLMKLRHQVEEAGWVETGRGAEDWAFRYTKAR